MDIQRQNSWAVFLIPVSSLAMAVRPRVSPLCLRLPQVPFPLQQHHPLLLHLHHSWHRLREVTNTYNIIINNSSSNSTVPSYYTNSSWYCVCTISDNKFWLRKRNWQIHWFHASDCQLVPRQRFIFLGSRAIEHPVLEVSSERRVKTCENMSDFQNFFPCHLRGQLSSPNPNLFAWRDFVGE